jgi:hypothetical protein
MQENDLIYVSNAESDDDLMRSALSLSDTETKDNPSKSTSSCREQSSCSGGCASTSSGLIDRLKEMFPDVENSTLVDVAQVSSSIDEAVEEILLERNRENCVGQQVDVIKETEGTVYYMSRLNQMNAIFISSIIAFQVIVNVKMLPYPTLDM